MGIIVNYMTGTVSLWMEITNGAVGLLHGCQTPAAGYMELVPQRDATALLLIIQQHVLPGTTIWSDQWAAYSNVGSLPGVTGHGVVNRSILLI